LDGDERKLWHFYPTMRKPNHVAVPQGDGIRSIWLALRQRLRDRELVGSGFRDGSLHREEILSEAWERLEWELDVRGSSVAAGGIRFTELRIRPRARTSTIGVEARCKAWILERAETGPAPRSRDELFAEAKRKFGPELTERGFLRAWAPAAPDAWKARGAKRQSPH
jgi:hypothetical protein